MHDVIIVGSGYGGCTAAKVLSERGVKDVLILERGAVVPHQRKAYSLGAQLTRLARLQNYSVSAVGGGSAINYGVFVPPSEQDLRNGFGEEYVSMRTGFMSLIKEWGVERPASGGATYLASEIGKKLGTTFRDTEEASKDYRNVTLRPKTIQAGVRRDAAFFLQSGTWETPPVPIRPCTGVDTIERTEEGTWRVHLSLGGEVLSSAHVLLCAGPIETPSLLLRSVRKGHIKSVHPSVGKHMQDHARMQTIACAPSGMFARDEGVRHSKIEIVYNTENKLPSTGERYDIHTEQVIHSGLDAVSVSTVACLPFPVSCLLNPIPNGCVCSEGFGANVCTVASLVPLGLGALFNPLAWCTTYDFVLGGATQPDGEVSLSTYGHTSVKLPKPSEEQKEMIRSKAKTLRKALSSSTSLTCNYESVGFDTQWHYVGTASHKRGALNSRFEVLDEGGRPIGGLYCGDASAASTPSQFNTGPLAAFAGYVAGRRMRLNSSVSASSMERS